MQRPKKRPDKEKAYKLLAILLVLGIPLYIVVFLINPWGFLEGAVIAMILGYLGR